MIEKLEKDMIDSLKNNEKERLTVIREIKSAMKLAQIDQKREMDEELLIEVVSKAIKTRKESIKEFEKGMKLSKDASKYLEDAEKKITILVNKDNEIKEEDF